MRYRGVVLAAGVVVLGFVAVGFGWWLTTPPRHTVTREAFDAIRAGMDEAQVRDRFGVPPGDYTTRPVIVALLDGNLPTQGGDRREWLSDAGVFWVWFDAKGRVTTTRAPNVLLAPAEPWLAKVRRWVGL